jgi:hypothetical protein
MDRVGLSFRSDLTSEQVRKQFVEPLRSMLETERAGIYSNYFHQDRDDPHQPTEHMLVFEVNEFKIGLRLLRTEAVKLGIGDGLLLHNLNPTEPPY